MQSPGAYALVNAMKNNPESVLIEIGFTVRLKNVPRCGNLILCIWEESASLWKQSDKRKLALCNVFFQNASITIHWKFFLVQTFPPSKIMRLCFVETVTAQLYGFSICHHSCHTRTAKCEKQGTVYSR